MEIDAPLKQPEFKRDEMGRFDRSDRLGKGRQIEKITSNNESLVPSKVIIMDMVSSQAEVAILQAGQKER